MSEMDEEKKKNKKKQRTKREQRTWKTIENPVKSLLSRARVVEYPCNILRASRVHDLFSLPFNDFPEDIKGKWQVDVFQGP